jgi:DUF971 family protein
VASLRKYEELSKYVSRWAFSWHPEFQQEGWFDKVYQISNLTNVMIRIMAPANNMSAVTNFLKLIDGKVHYEVVKIQPRGNININTIQYSKQDEQQLISWRSNKSNYSSNINKSIYLKNKLPALSVDSIGRDAEYIFDITDLSILRKNFQQAYINSNDIIKHGFTNYQGWSCNIGLESLFIQFDGSIRRGNCLVGGVIGNIQDVDTIKWPTAPIICNSNQCDCNTDIRITKKKPAEAG